MPIGGNEVGITGRFKDEISPALKGVRAQFDALAGSKGAQSVLGGVGLGVGLSAWSALSTGISKVVDYGSQAIQMASNLNETITKTQQIFGASADDVIKWGSTAAQVFGQTQAQALDAAGGFGNLFKSTGASVEDAARMAEQLTVLGTDLSSFFNTDVASALGALQSGLVGESEPLRRFGVFLSEATVDAELHAEGIKKVNGRYTESQKQLGRYNVILKGTKDAQGDFARTSDGLANSQRKLSAEFDQLQTEVGGLLEPAVASFVHFLSAEAVPAIHSFANALATIGGVQRDVAKSNTTFITDFITLNDVTEEGIRKAGGFAASHTRLRQVTMAAGDEIGNTASKTADAAREAARLAAENDKATREIKQLGNATEDAARDLERYTQATNDALEATLEARFGPQQYQLELANAKGELKDHLKHLGKLRDIKDPTKDQRKDMRDTKLEIIDDKRRVAELNVKLAEIGRISLAGLQREFSDLGINVNDVNGYVRDLLINISHLPGANIPSRSGLGTGKTGKQHDDGAASGGYRPPGWSGAVGEEGMEGMTLLAGGGAFITPNQGGRSGGRTGGGAPVVIHLELDGATVARVVDKHLYYEAARAPQSPYSS